MSAVSREAFKMLEHVCAEELESIRAEAYAKGRADALEEAVDAADAECDVSTDRTWVKQFYCGTHSCWFRSDEESPNCPVGDFALSVQFSIRALAKGEKP